jgi:HK97 family phage major capsid protein
VARSIWAKDQYEDDRNAILSLAQRMLEGAEAKGEMSEHEERIYEQLLDKAESMKRVGTPAVKPEGMGVPPSAGDKLADYNDSAPTSGRFAKILRSDESYRDYLVKSGRVTPDDREVTLNGFMRGFAGLSCNPAEKRALAEGAIGTGGAMVPVYLSGMWFDALRAQAVAFKAGAATLDMPTETVNIAKLTADPTVQWQASENTQLTESDPSFAQVQLVAKSLAVLTTVSIQLWEDAPNAGVLLTNSLTQAMSVGLDAAVFGGTGASGQPTGIKNQASIGTFSMGTNGAAVTNYDPILEAINVMQTANVYKNPTAAVMAPRTFKEFAEAKTSTNQYLARPASIANLPFYATTSIPVNETQGTSNAASSIYVADYSQCIIGMRANIRLQALIERYADFLQVGLLAFIRADVALAHPQAFVRVLGVN